MPNINWKWQMLHENCTEIKNTTHAERKYEIFYFDFVPSHTYTKIKKQSKVERKREKKNQERKNISFFEDQAPKEMATEQQKALARLEESMQLQIAWTHRPNCMPCLQQDHWAKSNSSSKRWSDKVETRWRKRRECFKTQN